MPSLHQEASRPGPQGRTIWTELGHLRSALRYAAEKNLIDKAPKIYRPERPAPRDKRMTRDEILRFLDVCEFPHIKLFAILAITTAARSGALLGLTWDRVDLEGALIHLGDPGRARTNKGRASLPMNSTARAALAEFTVGTHLRIRDRMGRRACGVDQEGHPQRGRSCRPTLGYRTRLPALRRLLHGRGWCPDGGDRAIPRSFGQPSYGKGLRPVQPDASAKSRRRLGVRSEFAPSRRSARKECSLVQLNQTCERHEHETTTFAVCFADRKPRKTRPSSKTPPFTREGSQVQSLSRPPLSH